METWYGSKEKKNNIRQAIGGADGEDIDGSIADYLKSLSLLKYVPLHYLAADGSWMPKESLVFFYVDPQWVTCLLMGAVSIGRDGAAQLRWDRNLRQQPCFQGTSKVKTGFILYSDVLKCWPGLRVQCQGEDGRDLKFLRLDGMAENMLIGIVEGEISRIIFRQPAESLHEGFERREGDLLVKSLKKITKEDEIHEVKLPVSSNRVVSVRRLKDEIERGLGKKLAPAEFGQQMTAVLQTYTIEIRR